ncbi:superfamily I DNA/RNA helicase [Desulfomicrobium macestii]|uniref:DNA 3'-5' helicase n=1 Tax=Desulfomicrobium macestii TaxID=90731 RepID=A0ABR9H2C0_9BACT|nr:UvrD-helicase domain-containing protein [Desulfomicrobium macestii]MBE1424854.1 superfamily I DNA/RNA helicase [Desulfomicrobium macestii]
MSFLSIFKSKQTEKDTPSEEQTLREILRIHGPIKAQQIASMLVNDYGLEIEKSDINSILYRMKARGEAQKDLNHFWSLPGVGKTIKSRNDAGQQAPVSIPEITFTEEQNRIIEFDPTGNLLIRGQAGCGKTTVLAARAGRILSVMGKGSLLFLTYNTALCAYINRCFRNSEISKQVKVSTFHEWAKKTASDLGENFRGWADPKWRSENIQRILKEEAKNNTAHRLLKIDDERTLLNWWDDEISWIFGQGFLEMQEYLLAERIGRGTVFKLSEEDRKLVWSVFKQYNKALRDENVEDYDNAGMLILRALDKTGELPNTLRYDHILIDEVQDFHQSWLLALAPFSRISLTLAGDLAQKIYKRNFTWKSVGIDIHASRSRKLSGSHRTTKQIMEVAMYVIENSDVAKSDDYVPPILPDKEGPKVGLIKGDSPKESWERGHRYIVEKFGRLRTSTVAIAMPFSKQVFGAQNGLKKAGITPSTAKGSKLGQFTNGIVVTTYHQLKGLEFDHIVIMGLDDKNFPGRFLDQSLQNEIEEDEQILRRLLYVAMTRAKKSLTLVGNDPFCRFFENVPTELFEEIDFEK